MTSSLYIDCGCDINVERKRFQDLFMTIYEWRPLDIVPQALGTATPSLDVEV